MTQEDSFYKSFDLVIPVNSKDIHKVLSRQDILKKYLNYTKLVVFSQSCNQKQFENQSIHFINEDNLVPKESLQAIFYQRGLSRDHYRIGWYEQQFLKMAYARICNKKYYLIWDSDTIPVKPVTMFAFIHPIFDLKTEHFSPYFVTMKRLMPDLHYYGHSYISEHMLVDVELMKKMLDEIEMNEKLPGKNFWEKILMAIDIKDLPGCGFSEFETFGSYVDTRYPMVYSYRQWKSHREIREYFDTPENLAEKDLIWLSQDFDAVTFENWAVPFSKENLEIVADPQIQQLYTPNQLFNRFQSIRTAYKKIN